MIKYIDGRRLYRAFLAGSHRVLSQREYLNEINVFPVADADTGANLAATLKNIISVSEFDLSLKATVRNMAETALAMARGNSGIIFSQFLYGISEELESERRQTIRTFSQALQRAVGYMYKSLLNPVEGTMITVIREWVESLHNLSQKSLDMAHVLEQSLLKARESLAKTPARLAILKKAGVVDAGGMGFVLFLEGIIHYLKTGKLEMAEMQQQVAHLEHHESENLGQYRYCCETLLSDLTEEPSEIVNKISRYGDSVVIAGGRKMLHMHLHSNAPTEVFHYLSQAANISSVKVDDMHWQHEIQERRKYKIGLVTDSAADFPLELKEKYQINTIPIKLIFGEDIYLDKVTIDPPAFYKKIESGGDFPHSSQPDPAQVSASIDFVRSHYSEVICISISSQLSGIYNLMQQSISEKQAISVFDSRHLSVSEGLLVLRVAAAIEAGIPYSGIIDQIPSWREGCWIFTDIHSLSYMVRGGRVSPLKGKIARFLNLKPIVSVDSSGKGIAWGKSFSRQANMKKIIKLVQEKSSAGRLWNYAIVHAQNPDRAEKYAVQLEKLLNKKPLYIMEISPVVGVHNGPGACAVGLLVEKEK
ncbi:MAG: DegV family EDD domain-containing protein [Candidatus Cloacimonetes bacterium]|nr:DegV family EDD domain-containing protein [Candidatus Cloacimonadota bacterium]